MRLFLGEYEHTLDDRGRVTLSRRIRQELTGNAIVLSRGFEGCIFGFDLNQWEAESTKHLVSPVTDDQGRKDRRYLFASAQKLDIDKLGRVILPTHLKEYGQIRDHVMIIGAGDHFEIWDQGNWEKYRHSLEEA